MTKQELIALCKQGRKKLKKYHVPINEQTITISITELMEALEEVENERKTSAESGE